MSNQDRPGEKWFFLFLWIGVPLIYGWGVACWRWLCNNGWDVLKWMVVAYFAWELLCFLLGLFGFLEDKPKKG